MNTLSKLLFLGFAVILLTMSISCRKDDNDAPENYGVIKNIPQGIYTGYFDYHNTHYWCSIKFDSINYVEWPSGGAMYQKSYGCLTSGKYTIDSTKLIFKLESLKFPGFPEECVNEMFLPGEYHTYATGKEDSIVFEKKSHSGRIRYYLKKQ